MPYYIGEEDPKWEEYQAQSEAGWVDGRDPVSFFQYIEPSEANTTVLPFAETPGMEPEIPRQLAYLFPPRPRRGFFARLFGKQAASPAATSQPSPEQLVENFESREKAISAHALWKVSGMTAACRAAGVKRVFGSYEGGSDESFTHFLGAEGNDGRMIESDELRKAAQTVDFEELVRDAAAALMGRFDAGPMSLYGAVVIDFDVCTITDEKNADVVFDTVVFR
jgi:hypothetical protein